MASEYTCPACGYRNLHEPPRLAGGNGSHEICYSCRFQYGYTDDDQGYTYESWRQRWVSLGMPWSARGESAPPGWDPAQQLADLLNGESAQQRGDNSA